MRISDWSSDVCSSDLERASGAVAAPGCCALSRDRGAERLSRRREYAAWPLSLPGPDLEIAGDQRKPHARHHVPHGSARQGDRPRLSRPREHRAQRERAIRARLDRDAARASAARSEEHKSELQSLMRISYAVFCLTKKKNTDDTTQH